VLSRGPPPGLPGTAPAPHVNPAFFPHGPPPGAGYAAPGVALGISEAEFDEIMSRNRTVSSSAIARAVQDAAAGEYASAIETLVTAISLIKQSKVAHDDRCRILVSSLQDTLHGIENKSYGASRSGGMRSRSRSRDRSHRGYREYGHSRTPDDRGHAHYRDDRGHAHYERRNDEERYRRDYRDRSRSRERQDRDKYYEERDHGKYFEERERRAKK
jgi:cleavage and polyadenylation specificity factor subunit 6/7